MTSVEEHLEKGIAYLDEGERHANPHLFKKAAIEFEMVLKIDPLFYEAWYGRGLAYMGCGETDKALESLKKVVELEPDHKEAWDKMGLLNYAIYLVQRKKEFLNKAVECLQKAVELDPEYIEALRFLGNSYDLLGEHNKGLDCFQKVLELQPDHLFALNDMGTIYRKMGEYDKAIENFQKVLDLNPGAEQPWLNLGLVYDELSVFDKAIEHYEKARKIKSNPLVEKKLRRAREIMKYIEKAHQHIEKGKHKKAIEEYRNASMLDKKSFTIWYEMGQAYGHLDDYKEAIECYEKALEINPSSNDVKEALKQARMN